MPLPLGKCFSAIFFFLIQKVIVAYFRVALLIDLSLLLL